MLEVKLLNSIYVQVKGGKLLDIRNYRSEANIVGSENDYCY